MECEEKKHRLLVYETAARFYSWALDQRQSKRPTADKAAYNDLVRLSQDARNQCNAARSELRKHKLEHGC
jgi:hypothetical protein